MPHLPGLGDAAPLGRRVTVGVGGAHPHAAETGPGGPDVVIHLPARPDTELFIGPADCLDDLAPDRQAEVSQAVQRLERANRRAEAPASQRGRPGDVRRARAGEGSLLVPRAIGGRTGQAPPGLGERLHQQRQAPRSEHGAALDEDDHRRLPARSQPVEAGRGAKRPCGLPLREAGQRRLGGERRRQGSVRAVGQQHHPGIGDAAGLQRPHRLNQARRFGVSMHPHHHIRAHGPDAAVAAAARQPAFAAARHQVRLGAAPGCPGRFSQPAARRWRSPDSRGEWRHRRLVSRCRERSTDPGS